MPLNQQSLQRKDAALADLLAKKTLQARVTIRDKIDDAEAHAVLALTKAVLSVRGGRPTLAEIRKSRGMRAALARLDELSRTMTNSIEAIRVLGYCLAISAWVECLDDSWLRVGAWDDNQTNLDHARTLVIHGTTIKASIDDLIGRSRIDLERTLTQAGTPSGPAAASGDEMIADWAGRSVISIAAGVVTLLQDSLVAIDRLAGRDCLDPSRRHPDPTLD